MEDFLKMQWILATGTIRGADALSKPGHRPQPVSVESWYSSVFITHTAIQGERRIHWQPAHPESSMQPPA